MIFFASRPKAVTPTPIMTFHYLPLKPLPTDIFLATLMGQKSENTMQSSLLNPKLSCSHSNNDTPFKLKLKPLITVTLLALVLG